LYLILNSILVAGAVLPIAFYLWYLTWPVCIGRVTRVDEWTEPANDVLRARKRRHVSYEYEWQGKKCTGTQQSLFLAQGLSPKKQVGDAIAVSVCSILPKMTCPWRPWFELIVVLLWAAFLLASALVGFLEFS